jgi:hypothetical protein
LAADFDAPAVGSEAAAGNAQQRRLAGTVLTQEGMDLAGTEFDRDVVVGLDRTERRSTTTLARPGHRRSVRRPVRLPHYRLLLSLSFWLGSLMVGN